MFAYLISGSKLQGIIGFVIQRIAIGETEIGFIHHIEIISITCQSVCIFYDYNKYWRLDCEQGIFT